MPLDTNNTQLLQDRKAMEESDHELTKELFSSSVVLPPIHQKKSIQCNKPELLQRQRGNAIKCNKMEENNLKLKELSKKIKETKKMDKKIQDVFGNSSCEWDNYVYLEDKYT
jgi:hypothetical protein